MLILVLLVLFLAGFATLLALHFATLRRLREEHPQAWRELGSPTPILNNSIANNIAIFRFVHRGRYKILNDPDLAWLFAIQRIVTPVYLLVLLAMLVAFWMRGS